MRALILSDIHANLEALNAVLAAVRDLAGDGSGYDEVWNLGDVVGYGGSPNEVIDLVRPLATLNVRGNHDRVCGGLASALGFNPIARAAAIWTHSELTPNNLEWLNSLSQGPIFPEHVGVCCAHGSPLNEDQYILSMRDAWAPLQQMPTPVTFFGHTHIQGGFSQEGTGWHEIRPGYPSQNGRNQNGRGQNGHSQNERECWRLELPAGTRHLINPGSVGQPRDFDWRAAFAMYEEAQGDTAASVTYYRVPYDLTASQGRILMAGLPERLAARLREGR
jgi:diadenosine tetraphosphatase ApaH/serine/threonine PP2A family protein phosphatase